MSASPVGTFRLDHLAMVPDRFLDSVHQRYGDRAIQAIRAACDRILSPEPKTDSELGAGNEP